MEISKGASCQGNVSLADTGETKRPQCAEIAARGVKTSGDFCQMMSALMSDLVDGAITPAVGNAVVNAGGKMLKAAELTLQYGSPCGQTGRELRLVAN